MTDVDQRWEVHKSNSETILVMNLLILGGRGGGGGGGVGGKTTPPGCLWLCWLHASEKYAFLKPLGMLSLSVHHSLLHIPLFTLSQSCCERRGFNIWGLCVVLQQGVCESVCMLRPVGRCSVIEHHKTIITWTRGMLLHHWFWNTHTHFLSFPSIGNGYFLSFYFCQGIVLDERIVGWVSEKHLHTETEEGCDKNLRNGM